LNRSVGNVVEGGSRHGVETVESAVGEFSSDEGRRRGRLRREGVRRVLERTRRGRNGRGYFNRALGRGSNEKFWKKGGRKRDRARKKNSERAALLGGQKKGYTMEKRTSIKKQARMLRLSPPGGGGTQSKRERVVLNRRVERE